MSGEMVKRIARILEPQAWAALGIGDTLIYENRRISSLRKAALAIAAMREPTEAMIEASNREWDGRMSHRSSGAWQAMIDAALSGGK
jgi:hypothetical protein